MEYDFSFEVWYMFYLKEAGLMLDEEFAFKAGNYLKKEYDVKKIGQEMLSIANPLLIESVQNFYCTNMKDREKSLSLLNEAAAQGDSFAQKLLEKKGHW